MCRANKHDSRPEHFHDPGPEYLDRGPDHDHGSGLWRRLQFPLRTRQLVPLLHRLLQRRLRLWQSSRWLRRVRHLLDALYDLATLCAFALYWDVQLVLVFQQGCLATQ